MAAVIFTPEAVEEILLSTINRYEAHMSAHYDVSKMVLNALRADCFNHAQLQMKEYKGDESAEEKETKKKVAGAVTKGSTSVEKKTNVKLEQAATKVKEEPYDETVKATKVKQEKMMTDGKNIKKEQPTKAVEATTAKEPQNGKAVVKEEHGSSIEWNEIIENLKENRDIAWKTFLAAARVQEGESVKVAANAVGLSVESFKLNYGVRASLLSELAVSTGCGGLRFLRIYLLVNRILSIKEMACNVMDLIPAFNLAAGTSAGREGRFELMGNPLLSKAGNKKKTMYPYGTGTGLTEEGRRYLQNTLRPTFSQ